MWFESVCYSDTLLRLLESDKPREVEQGLSRHGSSGAPETDGSSVQREAASAPICAEITYQGCSEFLMKILSSGWILG